MNAEILQKESLMSEQYTWISSIQTFNSPLVAANNINLPNPFFSFSRILEEESWYSANFLEPQNLFNAVRLQQSKYGVIVDLTAHHTRSSSFVYELAHKYFALQMSEADLLLILDSLSEDQRIEVNRTIKQILYLYYVLGSLQRFLNTLLKVKSRFVKEISTSLKKQKNILGKIKIIFAPTKIIPNSIRPIEFIA